MPALDVKEAIPFTALAAVDLRVAVVEAAPLTVDTRVPCRVLTVDLGALGKRKSVGQYALVPEGQLVGRKIVVCCNLGARRIGRYTSEVLTLGTPHPDSAPEQNQALPLYADDRAEPGDAIF